MNSQIEKGKNSSELQLTQSDFLKIYDAMPVPIVIFNGMDDSLAFNSAFVNTFGYTPKDIQSPKDWWNVAFPDENIRRLKKMEWNRKYRKLVDDNQRTHPLEWKVVCKDGSKKFVRYSLEVVKNFYISSFVDHTDLKQSENRLISILNAPKIPILLLNKYGIVLEINKARNQSDLYTG